MGVTVTSVIVRDKCEAHLSASPGGVIRLVDQIAEISGRQEVFRAQMQGLVGKVSFAQSLGVRGVGVGEVNFAKLWEESEA